MLWTSDDDMSQYECFAYDFSHHVFFQKGYKITIFGNNFFIFTYKGVL
jgi:hypothetical protein